MNGHDGRRRRGILVAAGALGAAVLAVAGALLLSNGAGHRLRGATSQTAPGTTTQTVPGTTTQTVPGPSAVGPPGQPAPAGEQFGASVNWLFNVKVFDPPQIDAQLAALRAAGATLARSDALWEATEPAPPTAGVHRYQWSFDDSIASALAAHGLRWLPIIDYSAPWAGSTPRQDHSPPARVGDYAAYAAAFASRYGVGGSFWRQHPELPAQPVDTIEIWNEPDNPGFWSPGPDAGRYDELYLGARVAIAAVNPSVRVIVGGLTAPARFLPAMLAARPDLRGHVDGIAIHPYAGNPLAVLARIRAARHVLRALGLAAVPLYVTEVGWTTEPPGALHYLAESLRPTYIEATIAALGHLDCGLAAALIYTWVTPERNRSNPEEWFGIDPPSAAGGPDAAAFTGGLRAARAAGAGVPLCGGG
jgi:hypothetical protein